MHGHRPNEMQVRVWNAFAEKLGWRDPAARTVARVNQRLGLGGELATIFECELALVSTKAASSGVLMNTYRHVGSLRTESSADASG